MFRTSEITDLSTFIDHNIELVSQELAVLLSVWQDCERKRERLNNDVASEVACSEEFEAERERLINRSREVIELLIDVPAQSVYDVAAKLFIWREATAPNVEDLSQFTSIERLGLSSCDAFMAMLTRQDQNLQDA